MSPPTPKSRVCHASAANALVIANPAAAAVTPSLIEAVEERLRPHWCAVQTAWTGHKGEADELAAKATADPAITVVVAVGGDGTVREVAEGMARAFRSRRRLGQQGDGPALLALPAGSGNSTCRNLWGEQEGPEVLDVALDPARSQIRHLDLMRLVEPGVEVLLGASSGFLAEVLIGARDVSGLTGRDRYFAAAVGVLAAMPSHPTRVMVDGRTVHDGPASLGGG